MELVLLPSATDSESRLQFLTTFLFDGVLAVDAGSLGFWGDLAGQARVRDVVLTHSHVDHTASLPVFLENVYGTGDPVTVHATAAVLDSLRRDVFNDRVFPDLLSRPPDGGPFVRLNELAEGRPVALAGHTVTAIPVDHAVPTVAVLVRTAGAAVLVVTDTGPTAAVWEFAATVEDLKAVLLEVTFPASHRWLADISGHLSTAQFVAECAKAPTGVPRLAIHLKPRFRGAITRELAALGLDGTTILEPGKPYRF